MAYSVCLVGSIAVWVVVAAAVRRGRLFAVVGFRGGWQQWERGRGGGGRLLPRLARGACGWHGTDGISSVSAVMS
jgi:hypothetical protein